MTPLAVSDALALVSWLGKVEMGWGLLLCYNIMSFYHHIEPRSVQG